MNKTILSINLYLQDN